MLALNKFPLLVLLKPTWTPNVRNCKTPVFCRCFQCDRDPRPHFHRVLHALLGCTCPRVQLAHVTRCGCFRKACGVETDGLADSRHGTASSIISLVMPAVVSDGAVCPLQGLAVTEKWHPLSTAVNAQRVDGPNVHCRHSPVDFGGYS